MNNVGEKFLPLGTVVILKGAKKRLMITGFCSMDATNQNSQMFDYSGCMFPEGFINSKQTALFNHDQIEKIYHMGLVDEEEKEFKVKLNQLISATTFVSATAPQSVLEKDGVAPVVQEPAVEEVVPPIGPGLPGYVAPQPEAVEQTVENVPPIGPGLPGYVAPQPVESAPVVENIPPVGPGLPGYVQPTPAPIPSAEPVAPNSVPTGIVDLQFDTNN